MIWCSEDRIEAVIFWLFTSPVTVKIATQCFCMTHQLMMLPNITKFGYKRLSSSKDIVQTNFNWNFQHLLWPSPWAHQSSIFPRHYGLWSTIKLSVVAKETLAQKSQWWYFSYICFLEQALTVTLTLKTETHLVLHDMCPTLMCQQTKFGYKRFSGSDDTFWTKQWHTDRVIPVPTPPPHNFPGGGGVGEGGVGGL